MIGAGPAGAAAALEATRLDRTVVLFERGEERSDKPCGEGIMPAGVEALRALGLGDAVRDGRAFAGVRHVVPGARPLAIDFTSPGVAIRRPELSAAFDAALCGVRGLVRVRADVTGEPSASDAGGRRFHFDAGPAGRFEARTLIAADGAAGHGVPWLRGERRARRASGRFGLRARFREGVPLDRVEVHMGRGCELYLTPLRGGFVNVVFLVEHAPAGVVGADALLAWGLSRHPAAASHLCELTTPPSGRSLERARPRTVAQAGAFLAGDAVGSVDPILGCGITIAVRTGVAAARGAHALLAGCDSREVERAHAEAVRHECAARHLLASLLRTGDAHPRLARAFVTVLGRAPRAARVLARIAGGR